MRDTIFISHATPEDNDFVRWLGAKLELAGYMVWHDLAQLKGGDYFWEKIEAAIRNDSFRFIAVVSKSAIGKKGVKDEWSVAGTVENTIPGFIIPVKLDDIAFSDVPISLHRKNLLDFAGGWHHGLSSLIETLEDARAPKLENPNFEIIRQWLPKPKEKAILKTNTKEFLDSSWVEIISLPPFLETARILGRERQIPKTLENRVLPWLEHEGRIVGFAQGSDLVSLMANSVMLEVANSTNTNAFIKTGSVLGDREVPWWQARKHVVHLVRQAWELAMEARGFACVEQSGGKKVFYVAPEKTGGRGKRISYEDFDGRKRSKALNGRSERRQACWAYGVGIVPSFDEPWRIELRAAVIFTDDNGIPITDAAKAHKLRRGFCKSWWNEHWRTLMRAFLWLASDGKSELLLPVGSDRNIELSAFPAQFEAPSGLSDVPPSEDVEPVEEIDDEEDVDVEDIV